MGNDVLIPLLTGCLGALAAVFGAGMARDMGGALASSVPGAVVGILAGAVHGMRYGVSSLSALWGFAALGGLLGASAAFLTTLRRPAAALLSGLVFGLLGGGPVGVVGGGLVGAFEALRTRGADERG
jgi:hypothetical protein